LWGQVDESERTNRRDEKNLSRDDTFFTHGGRDARRHRVESKDFTYYKDYCQLQLRLSVGIIIKEGMPWQLRKMDQCYGEDIRTKA
jgi:hypothetical protein